MKLSVMLSRLGPKLILLSQDAIFAHIVPHLDVNYEAETQMNSNGFRLQDLESQRSYPTPPFEHIFQPMPSRRSSTLHGMKKINFEDSDSEDESTGGKIQNNERNQCYICLKRLPNFNFYRNHFEIDGSDVESQRPKQFTIDQIGKEKKYEFLKYLKDNNLHMASTCKHVSCQSCIENWMKRGDFCGLCKTKFLIEDYPEGHTFNQIPGSSVTESSVTNTNSDFNQENIQNSFVSQAPGTDVTPRNSINYYWERPILLMKFFFNCLKTIPNSIILLSLVVISYFSFIFFHEKFLWEIFLFFFVLNLFHWIYSSLNLLLDLTNQATS